MPVTKVKQIVCNPGEQHACVRSKHPRSGSVGRIHTEVGSVYITQLDSQNHCKQFAKLVKQIKPHMSFAIRQCSTLTNSHKAWCNNTSRSDIHKDMRYRVPANGCGHVRT